ncbi:hypothetical protein HAX54_048741, partial [Datura stramonium]|nr:hypothetical protein [Datura stramonium]
KGVRLDGGYFRVDLGFYLRLERKENGGVTGEVWRVAGHSVVGGGFGSLVVLRLAVEGCSCFGGFFQFQQLARNNG